MKLFCYYDYVPQNNQENEIRMLNLWGHHHRQLGFEPTCLFEWHARKSPFFAEFTAAVAKIPSINPRGYDLACFHRWLAVANSSESVAIMMDYDTFLTPANLEDLSPLVLQSADDMGKIQVFQGIVPCLVMGTPNAFLSACSWFMHYPIRAGETHASDMTILEQIATARPDSFVRHDYVKCFGEGGWDQAKAVHFSNSCMTPNGKTPRFRHIPVLLSEHRGSRTNVTL